jgi:hypothetical protein
MGPFRLNLSRRGIGGSWGFPGFRVGMAADGKRYVSIGIPGTGLYYQYYLGNNKSSGLGNCPTLELTRGHAAIPDLSSLSSPASTPVVLPAIVPLNSPRAYLEVKRDGLTTGQRFDVVQRAVVGRAGESPDEVHVNLATIPEARYVSANHAEIRYEHGRGWLIRDLGSQNGSFVRPLGTDQFHRLVGEELVSDGDEVAFGNARLEFHSA